MPNARLRSLAASELGRCTDALGDGVALDLADTTAGACSWPVNTPTDLSLRKHNLSPLAVQAIESEQDGPSVGRVETN